MYDLAKNGSSSFNSSLNIKNEHDTNWTDIKQLDKDHITKEPMVSSTVRSVSTLGFNMTTTVANLAHNLTINLKDMVTNISEVLITNRNQSDHNIDTNGYEVHKIKSNDSSVEDIIIKMNSSKLFGANGEKTLEEEYLDQNNNTLTVTESIANQTMSNASVTTEIMAAMPGYPVFREPPKFMIHDPDDGPLEPYLRPDNESLSQLSKGKGDQQFVYVKRTEFEADKGSLEEKYKDLLVGGEGDEPVIDTPLDVNSSTTEKPLLSPNNGTNSTLSSADIKTIMSSLVPYINSAIHNILQTYYLPYLQYLPYQLRNPTIVNKGDQYIVKGKADARRGRVYDPFHYYMLA